MRCTLRTIDAGACVCFLGLLGSLTLAAEKTGADIPASFPTFEVPGHAAEMDSMRALFHLHQGGAGPKATLWDAWLAAPDLWPAIDATSANQTAMEQWRAALSTRAMDPDGYVHTHQHLSYAHDHGWPFPVWTQCGLAPDGQPLTQGWHFHGPRNDGMYRMTLAHLAGSDKVGEKAVAAWSLVNAETLRVDDAGWHVRITGQHAALLSPENTSFSVFHAPFIQVRWQPAKNEPAPICYLEWQRTSDDDFSPQRRVSFSGLSNPPSPLSNPPSPGVQHCMVQLYKHPQWNGPIKRLRVVLADDMTAGEFLVDSVFTAFDTRHPVNNPSYLLGAGNYYAWTGDHDFLRQNISKLRQALTYCETEFNTRRENHMHIQWWGHDGLPGFDVDSEGKKTFHYGHGIGNNYWDLMPFGGHDLYATSVYYAAVLMMADLEEVIAAHPEWSLAPPPEPQTPPALRQHAQAVAKKSNALFWNDRTQRFNACIDADGDPHDYGYTFLNLEAIYYGLASEEHARAILSWITGERLVEGDTACGADIYHWRFAPRATTRRNLDWYGWFWTGPESIPWGGQVQDGGAVMGFSYHDLSARLKTQGANNAWQRLSEIITWFDEVQAGGGYRKYYDGVKEASLQGCGTPGGLGLDCEFFESVLVGHFMLDGFLGFRPRPNGVEIKPQLPDAWEQLKITRIAYRGAVLDVTASRDWIRVDCRQGSADPVALKTAWRTMVVRVGGLEESVTQLRTHTPQDAANRLGFAANTSYLITPQ